MSVSMLQKIPAIVAAIILLVGLVIIYFRSKNVTRSEFIKIFKSTKFIQSSVVIFVCVLTGVFAILNHLNLRKSANAIIALNYSEASQAQNSNSTRYNMAEIISDEVLKRAIEKGALPDVSVKDLKKCVSVYPHVEGDVKDKSEYHISTEFVVEYHASKKTQHLDTENVIKLLAGAYKDYYIDTYTDKFNPDNIEDKPDFENAEYMDIVSYFDVKAASILNYLYGMAEKSPSFVTKNNTTFHSIASEVSQFKNSIIDQDLRSLILQQGVVRDKTGYIDRLSYQNTNTDFERRKNKISFDVSNRAIAMYSPEMTRVVLVPTWDGAGKYYMGRTKVGIDELSVKATAYSDAVAANEKSIGDNNLIIDKMQAVSGESWAKESAEDLIKSIDESLKSFAVEAIAAGREFSSSRMNQCIAVSISGVSLMRELKSLILFAIFAYAAMLIYVTAKKIPEKE